MVSTFEVLAEPHRRRILDLLLAAERPVGELVQETALSQPSVSKHLRVLREAELVTSEVDGARRIYRLQRAPFDALDDWLNEVRAFWDQKLDALETEVARGIRARRIAPDRADKKTDENTTDNKEKD
jgi:DNA-binding transcriptional ArsR family regulator